MILPSSSAEGASTSASADVRLPSLRSTFKIPPPHSRFPYLLLIPASPPKKSLSLSFGKVLILSFNRVEGLAEKKQLMGKGMSLSAPF